MESPRKFSKPTRTDFHYALRDKVFLQLQAITTCVHESCFLSILCGVRALRRNIPHNYQVILFRKLRWASCSLTDFNNHCSRFEVFGSARCCTRPRRARRILTRMFICFRLHNVGLMTHSKYRDKYLRKTWILVS